MMVMFVLQFAIVRRIPSSCISVRAFEYICTILRYSRVDESVFSRTVVFVIVYLSFLFVIACLVLVSCLRSIFVFDRVQ